jgi:5-amino-6-(5-phosphoribosylamino)uracil reductase
MRPYVLLSAAVSVDGYLDDASSRRLLLSDEPDFDRVDEVRAGVDAILVGANTVRRDDPRLRVRSEERRAARVARGEPENPLRVVVSGSGELDPGAQVFAGGPGGMLVYVPEGRVVKTAGRLGSVAVVVSGGVAAGGSQVGEAAVVSGGGAAEGGREGGGNTSDGGVSLVVVLADLAGRGVRRLMVEGGGSVLTQFLLAGLADELQLAIAPVFVGDPAAPRFAGTGAFPHHGGRRMELAGLRQVGDMAVLRYLLHPAGGVTRVTSVTAGP